MTAHTPPQGVGGRVASPPPPTSRGSRVPDIGARRLAYFLVRQPRFPMTSEPLAARQAAEAGRPTGAAATKRPPTQGRTTMTTRSRYTTNTQLPEAVAWLLDGHGGRCGCTGQCGRIHGKGRCNADELASLTVAPADLTVPLERAAVLPADELIVWCHRCRDLAQTVANRRRREITKQALEAGQLGLWGAA
jgi:hypothetical protein